MDSFEPKLQNNGPDHARKTYPEVFMPASAFLRDDLVMRK